MLLKVNKLSYSREHKDVIQNLSMGVTAGQVTVVLGANGSGKSSLLRLISGLTDPDAGEVFFEREKVLGPSSRLIPGHPGISLVRQDNRLLPLHTVRQNLRHILQFEHKEFQDETIEELSGLLSLQETLDRTLKYLSGGEQQRVSIAAALASAPRLLLLDEPFSQTDMFLKQELKNHLKNIVKKLGVGILFVTHDPEDALGLADRILILEQGKILEEGSSESLYYFPRNRSTAILTGYCSWLPVKDFPSFDNLHRIGDQYLVRPDKIGLAEKEIEGGLQATVLKEEFHGFYKITYLLLVETQLPIFVTRVSSSPPLASEKVVWVFFL